MEQRLNEISRAAPDDRFVPYRPAPSEGEIEAIKDATEKLMTSSQSFSEKLYQQASADNAASQGAAGGSDSASNAQTNDDDVVDAEIVEDEDDKK